MAKRLYRSTTNRMIWGVCGGLAEYFDIDPLLMRVIFVVLALANGLGILLYILLALVVPRAGVPAAAPPEGLEKKEPGGALHRPGRGPVLAGAILIALGLVLLLSNLGLLWWLSWGTLWPIILIAAGIVVLLGRWRR